jgi:cell division protein FtsN
MDEPRTHYQVSFTSKQAVALFVVLVIALAGSYFLGLLTGLSGRQGRATETAAAGATPSPEPAFPAPVLGVSARGSATRRTPTRRPTEEPTAAATPGVQLFEDRPSSEPTRAPAAAKAAPTKVSSRLAETSGFWVQVDSLSSKDQAESKRRGLAAAGFKATVVPGSGPKGAVYRVRVGPYATREEADSAAANLEAKAKVKPWVVPPGQ